MFFSWALNDDQWNSFHKPKKAMATIPVIPPWYDTFDFLREDLRCINFSTEQADILGQEHIGWPITPNKPELSYKLKAKLSNLVTASGSYPGEPLDSQSSY